MNPPRPAFTQTPRLASAQGAASRSPQHEAVDTALEPVALMAEHEALDMQAMRAHADEAVSMLKTLGNTDRLMLLCQLTLAPCTVGELEQLTGILQPTLSQQLSVLRREGVVRTEREGKFIRYQLADVRTLQLMQLVHRLFCHSGAEA